MKNRLAEYFRLTDCCGLTPLGMAVYFGLLPIGMILVLASCQFGGKETTHEVIMVEPGRTVEIADEREIQCIVIDDGGAKIVVRRKLAGTVAMPKAVYRELRAKAYPEDKK